MSLLGNSLRGRSPHASQRDGRGRSRSRSRARARPQAAQLSLDLAHRRDPRDKRGGAQPGAGRPRSPHSGVPHRVRPALSRHHPVHVTLRVRRGSQGLRIGTVFKAVRRALAAAREQFGFRLAQYSVQGNHIHIIAEANDRRALTRGIMGVTIRVALAVNKARGRRGRVFGDRYHARQLRTPLEVRRALLYVLQNHRRHLAERGLSLAPWHFDACSSATEFDGWLESELLALARGRPHVKPRSSTRAANAAGVRAASTRAADDAADPSVSQPRSFLLRVGWRRHGLLRLDEAPGA